MNVPNEIFGSLLYKGCKSIPTGGFSYADIIVYKQKDCKGKGIDQYEAEPIQSNICSQFHMWYNPNQNQSLYWYGIKC
jgi:hypothetical protein